MLRGNLRGVRLFEGAWNRSKLREFGLGKSMGTWKQETFGGGTEL
jgi:hypothetical protein